MANRTLKKTKKAEQATGVKKQRIRDAEATQRRILAAAKKEFSTKGLAGARVDIVAAKAKANKRMIYHYFFSKEALFTRVLEDAYLDIRNAEHRLELDDLPPKEALERLVRFTWNYYLANPEFLTLVNSENLHRAKHLKKSEIVSEASRRLVEMVGRILKRGEQEGVFRPGISPVQLNITLAAIGYYYITNRFTGSIIYSRDLMAPEALEERIQFNVETIMRLVCN